MLLPETAGAVASLPSYKPMGNEGDISPAARTDAASPSAKFDKRLDDEHNTGGMYVLNRRGEKEAVSFDQILHRVQSLCYGLHPLVDPARVSQAVINGMFAGIRTSQLDELAAQTSGESSAQKSAASLMAAAFCGVWANVELAVSVAFGISKSVVVFAAYMAATHPDFSKLAARIAIDNLHKNTSSDFAEVVEKLYSYVDVQGRPAPLIHEDVYKFVMENRGVLNAAIKYRRDFDYDYFAFKTLER